jgi:ADP-heptose:LPS heptosyltransferase
VILLSPWSRKTTDGKPSPKNYPFWPDVVSRLKSLGHEVVQVSPDDEPSVVGAKRVAKVPLKKLEEFIRACDTWCSVDNFWHHLAWSIGEPGVVIFGTSDPLIFGHPENMNLLKSRKFLRERQFGLWSQDKSTPEMFVGPELVANAAVLSISKRKARKS